jgi:Flp pilus assembly protein TadG
VIDPAPVRGRHQVDKQDERGSATVFVVFLAVVFLAGAGLVIDGGYALAARRAAMNHAEQSARVAADQLSEPALRDGTVQVDPGRARAAALDYLQAAGADGEVLIQGDQVTVTVTGTYRPALLTVVGVDEIPIGATATATSVDQP